MSLYDKNLALLGQVNPNLAKVLRELETKNYRVEASRSGLMTLVLCRGENEYYIHSKFKPDAEALKLVGNVDLDADHFIVLGLGLGYHLSALLNNKAKMARVLLVEPDLEIVKHSLHTLNWSELLKRDDFFYCFGDSMNLLASSIQPFIDVITFDKLVFVELPSEVRFLGAYFNEAKQKVDDEIKTLLYDFKTRLAEEAMVPRNILKNASGILKTRPVKVLKDRFMGKPGIIVSAGPSLDKNILYLKKVRDRAVIICVDTALKPLLKRGIQPHFTVTADPSYKNYLHLQGTEESISYFILADTGVSARVFEDFNRHIFSVSLGKPIIRMMEENMGEIGELEAWGSVISLALNFALFLGLEPIVFMGQDFAFSGLRNHCRGTSWEENWMEYSDDLALIQRKENQSISGIAKISHVTDIYGHDTISSDRLLLYKNYLAKFLTSCPERRFINASEGGVLTEIETLPMERVIKEFIYNSEAINFSPLYEIPVMDSPRSRKQLVKFFKAKSTFFKKYKRKLEEIIPRLEKLESFSMHALQTLLQEAEKLKVQLYANVQNGELVEMWSQGPIYDFLKRMHKLERPGFSLEQGQQMAPVFKDYFTKLLPSVSNIIESFDISSSRM